MIASQIDRNSSNFYEMRDLQDKIDFVIISWN